MADIAAKVVVLGVEGGAHQVDQRAVGAALALDLQADDVLALGLGDALRLLQLGQALALAPVELLAAALRLVALGELEQHRVALLEADPLPSALEKTEVAAAAL